MVWSPPGVEVSVYQILNLCRVMDGLVFNSKLAVGGRGPSPGLLTDHRWRRCGPMSHHRLWGGMDHYVVVTAIMVVVIATQSSTRAKDRYDHELRLVLHTFSLKFAPRLHLDSLCLSLTHFYSRLKWAEYLAAGLNLLPSIIR